MVHPGSVVKNIVLVHGAFADGSCWSRIIPLLEDKGYSVVAVQNPLTSLADDAAATRRTIALQDGPVILVGHSRTSPLGVPALGRCCDYPGGR
jgi:pimeloyl-ACP methyl ester carboxylesterase